MVCGMWCLRRLSCRATVSVFIVGAQVEANLCCFCLPKTLVVAVYSWLNLSRAMHAGVALLREVILAICLQKTRKHSPDEEKLPMFLRKTAGDDEIKAYPVGYSTNLLPLLYNARLTLAVHVILSHNMFPVTTWMRVYII